MARDTPVQFAAYTMLIDDRWNVRPEYRVSTTHPGYRSGRIRADLAILDKNGRPLFLIEAKGDATINKEHRQYKGYRGTGIGFAYVGKRDLALRCQEIRELVSRYLPNPVPPEHAP